MQEGAGPEWDHIDQPTLEEVERSWAHSSFWEVVFNISGCLCFDEVCVCHMFVTCFTLHLTRLCYVIMFWLYRKVVTGICFLTSKEAHWMQP